MRAELCSNNAIIRRAPRGKLETHLAEIGLAEK